MRCIRGDQVIKKLSVLEEVVAGKERNDVADIAAEIVRDIYRRPGISACDEENTAPSCAYLRRIER